MTWGRTPFPTKITDPIMDLYPSYSPCISWSSEFLRLGFGILITGIYSMYSLILILMFTSWSWMILQQLKLIFPLGIHLLNVNSAYSAFKNFVISSVVPSNSTSSIIFDKISTFYPLKFRFNNSCPTTLTRSIPVSLINQFSTTVSHWRPNSESPYENFVRSHCVPFVSMYHSLGGLTKIFCWSCQSVDTPPIFPQTAVWTK